MDLTGARWRKSSYSGSNGGNCVEVDGLWRKSYYSASNGGDCVEVAAAPPAAIAVRDSKDPGGPKLIFTPAAWAAFTAAIRTAGSG